MIVADRAQPFPTTAPQALSGAARADVCILGAGLAGMIAAYLLGREGREVMVIEEGPLGGLQPGFEAAHLASAVERPYAGIEAAQGRDAARVAAQSAAAAVDALEAIVLRERIACEFERLDGYLMGDGECRTLDAEFEAARRAGVHDVELVDTPPLEGSAWRRCVRYPAQAHFHPARFLAGLARAVQRGGGRIHCGVSRPRIEAGPPVAVVTSAGHRIEARTLVSSQPTRGGIAAPVAAPRMAHTVGLRVPRGSVPRALYWESSEPVRWMRLRSQGSGAGEVLLAGAEDPPDDDDHTAYRYLGLEAWARERFPRAREVVQRITGEIAQTPDLLALSCRGECDSQSMYLATGGWGTPMTRAAIAAMAIKDFVEGGELPWSDLYPPEACYVPLRTERAL